MTETFHLIITLLEAFVCANLQPVLVTRQGFVSPKLQPIITKIKLM
jgi:hypothetical protein